jgi:hypothetical protein
MTMIDSMKTAGAAAKAALDAVARALDAVARALDVDADGIPEALKVENRKPLTAEQEAKLAEAAAKVGAANAAKAKHREEVLAKKRDAERVRRQAKKEKAAAEASGEAAKMPLSGKDAAKAIAAERRKKVGPKEEALRAAREAGQASGDLCGPAPAASKLEATTAANRREPDSKPKGKKVPAAKPDMKATTTGSGPDYPAAPAPAPAAAPAKAAKAKGKGTSKTDIAHEMLVSEKGATKKELSEATGWPHVNLKFLAKRANMKLKRGGERFRLVAA